MQVKQHKYIRAAYVTLATLCITLTPLQVSADSVSCALTSKNTAYINSVNGNYQTTLLPIVVKNNSSTDAKKLTIFIGWPNVTGELKNADGSHPDDSLYFYGVWNGSPYIETKGSGILVAAGQTRTFYVEARYNATVNNQPLTTDLNDNIFQQPSVASCSGVVSQYTADVAPPAQTQRIVTTQQAGQVTSSIATMIKDNFWAILGVFAFGVGLLMVNRWLERKEMGSRRV